MTFVNGKKIVENTIDQGMSGNFFTGMGKVLDLKFNTVFSFDENSNKAPSFNVQNNPPNHIENVTVINQPIDGHSIDYMLSPNSVFDGKISTNNSNADNFRNYKTGTLDFDS